MLLEKIPKEFPELKFKCYRKYTDENRVLLLQRKKQTLLLKEKELSPEKQRCEPPIPFELVVDWSLAYNTFKRIRQTLPKQSGHLIIFGLKKGEKVILDVIHSSSDLRNEFSATKNSESRWSWCRTHLKNGLTSLEFQQAKEK